MTAHASGAFDVTITPQTPSDKAAEGGIGRMSIDKHFHGDLDGTSKGEMLAAFTADNGSAVYVAIEKVSATLGGRGGTFVLNHTGISTRDGQQLTVNVSPESGTGQLAGLTGSMKINIVDKKHFYEFDYALPDAP
ncbi:MAG: DUF3224 domain-containing protein [Gemmatimonadota bacterium]|nr:DUF3224 domain-containing protein [Gemmatimonadota bacterium]